MPSRNEITYCTFRRTFFPLYQGFQPGSPPSCCPRLLVGRAGQGDERILAHDRVPPLHRAAHGVDAGAGGIHSVTDQNTLLDAQCQSRVFCRGGVRGDANGRRRHVSAENGHCCQCWHTPRVKQRRIIYNWWLAYDYFNYRLSCAKCNRSFGSGGKNDKFPLKAGTAPAGFPNKDDTHLLLDPCKQGDPDLIDRDESGKTVSLSADEYDHYE